MSPPIAPKARTAPPPCFLNGHDHASHKSSPLGRTSINAREREALTASIESSHNRRQPIDLNAREEPYKNGYGHHSPTLDEDLESPPKLDVAARDPRDEAPETSPASTRPDSPYTLNPPIDFDGLSWPCELRYPVQTSIAANVFHRSRNKRKEGGWTRGSSGAPTKTRRSYNYNIGMHW